MTIVIRIFDKTRTVLRDTGTHKLADNTAEVGRHEHRFQALNLLREELLINETEKGDEVVHREIDMLNRASIWHDRRPIKTSRINGYWRACG